MVNADDASLSLRGQGKLVASTRACLRVARENRIVNETCTFLAS